MNCGRVLHEVLSEGRHQPATDRAGSGASAVAVECTTDDATVPRINLED